MTTPVFISLFSSIVLGCVLVILDMMTRKTIHLTGEVVGKEKVMEEVTGSVGYEEFAEYVPAYYLHVRVGDDEYRVHTRFTFYEVMNEGQSLTFKIEKGSLFGIEWNCEY